MCICSSALSGLCVSKTRANERLPHFFVYGHDMFNRKMKELISIISSSCKLNEWQLTGF